MHLILGIGLQKLSKLWAGRVDKAIKPFAFFFLVFLLTFGLYTNRYVFSIIGGSMEDGLLIEEDIGGSEWKLISLFAVFDGHGGSECMEYIKENLIEKVKEWTPLLD